MKHLFILTFISTFIIGCAQEKPVTVAKINLTQSANAELFPGGVFISGYHLETKQRFSKRIIGTEHDMELPSGLWQFRAHAWSGNSNMEGELYCFSSGQITLDQIDVEVDVNLAKKNCALSAFSKTDYVKPATDNSGETFYYPKPIQLVSCELDNEEQITPQIKSRNINPLDKCENGKGQHRSFTVSYFDHPLAPEDKLVQHIGSEFTSRCFQLDSVNYNSSASLILPITNHIPVKVKAFYSNNCDPSKGVTDLLFDKGIHDAVDKNARGLVKEGDPAFNKIFALSKVCDSSYASQSLNTISSNMSSYGVDGTKDNPFYICNASQFNEVGMSGLQTQYFKLMNHIDFASSGVTVTTKANPFNGSLHGNNFKLSNMTINGVGLFSQITPSASEDVEIRDLEFINARITNSAAGAGVSTGILASHVLLSSSARVTIEDIKLLYDNPTTVGINSTEGHVGGLIGKVTTVALAKGGNISSIISNVNIDADCSLTCEGVGGLVGTIQLNERELRIDDISITAKIETDHIKVGGILGSSVSAHLSRAHYNGEIQAKDYTGGIVGDSKDSEFHIVQANMTYKKSAPADASSVGGFAGILKYYNNRTLVNHADATLIYNSVDTSNVHDLGGLVGKIEQSGTPTVNSGVHIDNSFASVQVNSNGNQVGGLVGIINKTQPNGMLTFKNSRADGFIKHNPSSPSAQYYGGLVGKINSSHTIVNEIQFEDIISQVNILAKEYAGGLVGYNINGNFKRIKYSGDVETVDGNAGGIAGKNHVNGKFINIHSKANVSSHNNDNIARIAFHNSYTVSSPTPLATPSYVLVKVSETTLAGNTSTTATTPNQDFDPICAGTPANCTVNDWSALPAGKKAIKVSGATANGGAYSSELTDWNQATKVLHFDQVWFDASGATLIPATSKRLYRSGNWFEPFEIETVSQWNSYALNPFFYRRTLSLKNDLDFGNNPSNFYPFGKPTQGFNGVFKPNGKVLRNINIDFSHATYTGADYTSINNHSVGIFRSLGVEHADKALIGLFNDPLRVENIEINGYNQPFSDVGIITGRANNATISASIKNAKISNFGAGSNRIGGIAGQSTFVEIINTSFEGMIDSQYTEYVAGIVGEQKLATTTPYNSRLEIRHSKVSTSKFYGKKHVAGFVSKILNSSNNEEIRLEHNHMLMTRKDDGTRGSIEAADGNNYSSFFFNFGGSFDSNFGEMRKNLIDIREGAVQGFYTGAFASPGYSGQIGEKNYVLVQPGITPQGGKAGAELILNIDSQINQVVRFEDYGPMNL